MTFTCPAPRFSVLKGLVPNAFMPKSISDIATTSGMNRDHPQPILCPCHFG
ncbi:Uncharacterised protein [Vibrio cholerae]|nr:Uncharacterised protein [Vibrio cholerae]